MLQQPDPIFNWPPALDAQSCLQLLRKKLLLSFVAESAEIAFFFTTLAQSEFYISWSNSDFQPVIYAALIFQPMAKQMHKLCPESTDGRSSAGNSFKFFVSGIYSCFRIRLPKQGSLWSSCSPHTNWKYFLPFCGHRSESDGPSVAHYWERIEEC